MSQWKVTAAADAVDSKNACERDDGKQAFSYPSNAAVNTWDSENRLLGTSLPDGTRNTMSYRVDGLRSRLQDTEGDQQMVWDSQGSSGYQDLLEERLP